MAALVAKGDVTPLELVDQAIERIEVVNGSLNAVVTRLYDRARDRARLYAGACDLPSGPLAGVPFLVKDLVASVAGTRQTEGSRAFADCIASTNSLLVDRFEAAGLIIIAKTNTPEFGLVPVTEPALFGPCRSPWDLGRTPGGSSGGSAAAVAAGVVPMAHANDGGGSIRIPASCCGLFGLKPTRGRNPIESEDGPLDLLVEHAVTRSVRDSAALLDATRISQVGLRPGQRYFDEVATPPGRLRVAVQTHAPAGSAVHPDCVAAAEDAAALCEALGHAVTVSAPPVDGEEVTVAFMDVWSTSATSAIDDWSRVFDTTATQTTFEPLTWALAHRGRGFDRAHMMRALQALLQASRQIAEWMDNYDVWLTPVLAEPPLPIGALDAINGDPLAGFWRARDFVPFTPIANITGQPAMSVPLFINDAGLPIGVQFAGRCGDEATLFRLAGQLERARPWIDHRPPIFAT